jgi:hypothetical protein
LTDRQFYINKNWNFKPDNDIIKDKTDLLKIIKPYSNHLQNEVLFPKKISLKKYLKEIHLPIRFINKQKINIDKLTKLVHDNYGLVSITIIHIKPASLSKTDKYFLGNCPIKKLVK